MDQQTFVQLITSFLSAIAGASAAYAAVKEKMGELMARLKAVEETIAGVKKDGGDALQLVRAETNHAHARLDAHIERFHSK